MRTDRTRLTFYLLDGGERSTYLEPGQTSFLDLDGIEQPLPVEPRVINPDARLPNGAPMNLVGYEFCVWTDERHRPLEPQPEAPFPDFM